MTVNAGNFLVKFPIISNKAITYLKDALKVRAARAQNQFVCLKICVFTGDGYIHEIIAVTQNIQKTGNIALKIVPFQA